METVNKNDSLSDEKNNLCRVCLSPDEENKCIFTFDANFHHGIHSPSDLWEKLQFYGGIEVTENDGLPEKICNECICKLYAAHEFRTQCQATDKILRSIRGDGEDKINSTLERVRGLEDSEKESKQSVDEFVKLDELNRDKLIDVDKDAEINRRELKYSENEISFINGVENIEPMCKEGVSESRTIPVLKKVNRDLARKASQANKNTKFEDRSSESIFQDSVVDKRGEITKEGKSVSKREGNRSRRVILFKRATSMTNLRNNRERQRQYIKKTLFTKLESSDRDNATITNDNSKSVSSLLQQKCSKCCRTFSSKTALESHVISHESDKFSCDRCSEEFSRVDEFLEHEKTHKPDEKFATPASCKICYKNFRKAVTMVRHLNVHKRENPGAVYSILKDIRDRREGKIGRDYLEEKTNFSDRKLGRIMSESHMNSNCEGDLEAMELTCNICNAKFSTADMLKSHRENCGNYVEKLLDESSAIKLINIWIKEELDSDNEGKGFSCEDCEKSYATEKSLLKHREKMHANIIAPGSCSRCGEDCSCADITKGSEETREKTFTCEECSKTFENAEKLEKHRKIHRRTKEQQDANFRRFLCHICSKTFRQNTGLMFHMRTHTGYKPHVCKYCGRGFTSNSNCINHERTHTGDRPFVCHFCSAAFAKSCTLKAHITTHTGEANYHCKTCGKSFRRLKYLKEHRFTHTGEKPYACKICGTAYSHSGSLFVHEKKCKAQEGNYPAVIQVSQDYSAQPMTTNIEASSMPTIIPTLPSSHHINTIENSLIAGATKACFENIPRISHSFVYPPNDGSGTHIHMSSVNDDIHAAATNFTVVSQMFHT